MFTEIFLFEIKYRLRKLDTYLFFLFFFIANAINFAVGSSLRNDYTFVNSPAILADAYAGTSVFMMVVCGAIMSSSLYRDIEFNVYESYISLPISRNGYFWGRFLGSFLFVVVIGSSLIWGALAGTYIGSHIGLIGADKVGPYLLVNYFQPFFGYVIPNLFLSSAIFFGLVAYTRNTRVIYAAGVILFFGYMLSLFALSSLPNKVWVYLLDPFAFEAQRLKVSFFSPEEEKTSLVSIAGWMLVNRILWGTIGLLILLGTWFRFSFARFFSERENKRRNNFETDDIPNEFQNIPPVSTDFTDKYNSKVTFSLTKIELINIFKDNYFRLILSGGICTMAFMFWNGAPTFYGVPDFPRTVRFLAIYDHNFQFFAFLVIIFYTGEALHREKISRFAAINDSLPPSDRIFYGSKLFALLFLPLILSVIPMSVGVSVQLIKGYVHFNFPVYFSYCLGILLPKYLEMLMFSFAVHALINNKFAGHAVGICVWWLLWLANNGAMINYNIVLYSYTPSYSFSDMDGIGPTRRPLFWFNLYWLFNGGLLVLLGTLFYPRGVMSSFKERIHLAGRRFQLKSKLLTAFLFFGFVATGVYNYYQVSIRSSYLTVTEAIQRAVAFERQLKKYERDPMPSIVKYRTYVDVFVEERRTSTRADFTLVNKTEQPINRILLDGDQLSEFSIKCNGKEMAFISPLIYSRAKFSLFRPAKDTSMYRIYMFPKSLAPGDTALLEILSAKEIRGFSNRYSSSDVLHNGTFFNGGLPGLGYDDNEELGYDQLRKQYGLPKEDPEFSAQVDSEGISKLLFTNVSGLTSFEATISTSADQVAIAPGTLEKAWVEKGRNYYHYVLDNPKTYFLFPVLSAKYLILRDSIKLANGKRVGIEICYNSTHNANLTRFLNACKDGLNYYSSAFGTYQFKELRLLESSIYTQWTSSFPNCISFSENYGWNASFTDPDQFDYCYFFTAFQLAHQWWMFQVAPNHTLGSYNILDGLSKYGALMVYEKKVGKNNMRDFIHGEMNYYLDRHKYAFGNENPLVDSKDDYVWSTKAGLILYSLKGLIGEDSLNAAIKEFRDAYAFRNAPPYAGSNDLFRYIRKHVPDSFQYYLSDSWEKITLYDNKIIEATSSPVGKNGFYKVHLRVSVGKRYCDSSGNESPAIQVSDYIDIGVFGVSTRDSDGRTQTNQLYLRKYKLTAGEHSFDIIVKEKPISAGIDPYGKLIDRRPDDNTKNL